MSRILSTIKTNWVALTLFTLAAVTTLSLWPLEKLPSVPGTDKSHHLIAYAVLMFFAAFGKPAKRIVFSLLFISYAGVIELLQPYVNRYGDWLDMAANAMGLICGLIIAEVTNRLFHTISDPNQ